ncbi:MAG TPA: NADH:flavin oxidoreductase/NADH oxidase [Candidatus Acidoferrales bacterium]|jgi:2,4-dienoyl-CoA reductase-like NADH-dependent reductase (Old Yellow Enzyme family)|nr:NADH:flavin oxidoreductase/NADH oxidase [Candidatus Acidoferrales bacterium]
MDLFDPLEIRGVRLANRIVVSPMCQYSSPDGFATDWHLVHLGSRAVGGAALVFTEACAVTPEGRISPWDLGIWKDEHVEPLSRITRFLREQDTVPGIQLAHAGRKGGTKRPWEGTGKIPESEGGWQPLAPSALAFEPSYPTPAALDEAGIRRILSAFSDAARRALDAGFEVIEIHAAHGYLIHEFLSPLSNQRTDSYGGSLDNRIRLLYDTVAAVRKVWPAHLPLFVRISATDWVEGGWDVDQSIYAVKKIAPLGVDLIDCSSGGLDPRQKIPISPGYQVPFAQQIRDAAAILTGAVGMIEVPDMASQILRHDKADVVIFAREFLRRPYWPIEEASKMGVPLTWPAQYLRAAPNGTAARGPVFPKLSEAAEKDVATAQGRRS